MAKWNNWSGCVEANPRQIVYPSSEADIIGLIKNGSSGAQTIRTVGSGHSFTPLCATDGILVSLDKLQGITNVAPDKKLANVLAGTKLSQLGEPLLASGAALPTQGDIDQQSIAGAISTGTHGSGIRFPSLSSYVAGLRLVLASGDVLTCSTMESPELFDAVKISLGLFGIVSQVSYKLLPCYRLREKTWIATVDEALDQFPLLDKNNRHVEFFWVPQPDKCAFKTLNVTDGEVSDWRPTELKPPGTIERYIFPERVDWSYRIFPSQRSVRFNEMEFAVSYEQGRDCFAEIRRLMQTRHRDVKWAVEYRSLGAEESFLSPSYKRDSVTISIHQAAERPHREFFGDAESIFRNFRGRPHWGKIHSHTARELRELYPMWDRFLALRHDLDPDGRLLNDHLRRVLLD